MTGIDFLGDITESWDNIFFDKQKVVKQRIGLFEMRKMTELL